MSIQVERFPFWDKLNKGEQELLRRSALVKHFIAGQMIHGNCDGGNGCLGMVHVLEGEIKAFVVSQEGREVTIFKLKKDECCVFAASCVLSKINQDTQMIAATDVDIMVVPAQIYARLCRDNIELKCFSYELATEKYTEVMSVFEDILFTPFETRLARFLVNQCESTGSNEIKMTQEQIAQAVNSAREVVARAIRKLIDEKIVTNRRGVIVVEDIEGLKLMV